MRKLKPDFFHRIAYLEWRKIKRIDKAFILMCSIKNFFD